MEYVMGKTVKMAALVMALILTVSCLAGCQQTQAKTYTVLEENFGSENYAIGFRNEDIALGLEVQRILDEMVADGKAAEISEKWFGTDTWSRCRVSGRVRGSLKRHLSGGFKEPRGVDPGPGRLLPAHGLPG